MALTKILLNIGAIICLFLGSLMLREVVDSCWEGYVSPPIKSSDLLTGVMYVICSFIPPVLLIGKFSTQAWYLIIIGIAESIVIGSMIYLFAYALTVGGH
jgi:hypothetical protein